MMWICNCFTTFFAGIHSSYCWYGVCHNCIQHALLYSTFSLVVYILNDSEWWQGILHVVLLEWYEIAIIIMCRDMVLNQFCCFVSDLPSLSLLTQELAAVCEKWKYVGEELGVEQSLLSHLDTTNSDPNYCLQLVLSNRLESYATTWKDIVAVLSTRGIAESQLADNLEAKYCSRGFPYTSVNKWI